jgi:hypothetical protein
MFKVCLHNNCISHANFRCPLVIANKRKAVYIQATFRSTATLFFIFNNKLSVASYDPLEILSLTADLSNSKQVTDQIWNSDSLKSNPSSYLMVTWIRTLPWVTWEAVTGVESIPCWGLLQHTLAKGALVYPRKVDDQRKVSRSCMPLG